GLPAARSASAARTHGPHEHVYQGKWKHRLGMLSMGLFGYVRRAADGIAGSDERSGRKTKQPVGHCAQPHFSHAGSAAHSCKLDHTPADTHKAKRALAGRHKGHVRTER